MSIALNAIISLLLTILGTVFVGIVFASLLPDDSVLFYIGMGILSPGYFLWAVFLSDWVTIHDDVKFYIVIFLANFIFYFLLILLITKIIALFRRCKSP